MWYNILRGNYPRVVMPHKRKIYINYKITERSDYQMNLNNDILRYAIPHQCNQCTMNLSCDFACHNTPNPRCMKFVPDNMDDFLNDTITYFESNITKSKYNKLRRVCTYSKATNDKVTTLDTYYVNFINDCISELRNGKTVYVFKLSQLWEILPYVDGVKAVYQGDGIIGLVCKNKTNKSKNNKKE